MELFNSWLKIYIWLFVITIILVVIPPQENKSQVMHHMEVNPVNPINKNDVHNPKIDSASYEFDQAALLREIKTKALIKAKDEADNRADKFESELQKQKQVNAIALKSIEEYKLLSQETKHDTIYIIKSRRFPFLKTRSDTIYVKNNF